MADQEERQVLEGLQKLDPQVISAIYDRFFPVVFRYVRYRMGSNQQAEDITSDVFVRMLEAVTKGKGPDSNIQAWLLGTASHAVNDHYRLAYKHPVQEIDEAIPDRQATPAETVEHRDRQRRVIRAMTHLTLEQQDVLALRFGQELSLEETAVVMKKNVNAVKQLQLRALSALNRQIDETP
jgi:RNA polymerase sigma-70 factor, ECF subfamily